MEYGHSYRYILEVLTNAHRSCRVLKGLLIEEVRTDSIYSGMILDTEKHSDWQVGY